MWRRGVMRWIIRPQTRFADAETVDESGGERQKTYVCVWHVVGTAFIRSGNICLELRRVQAGGNNTPFEVDRRHSCRGTLLCSKAMEGTAPGSVQHQELTPAPLPRHLLPRVLPSSAVISKDRQGRAIWPHVGFPGHILGIQTMPPPRLYEPPLHPHLSVQGLPVVPVPFSFFILL